MNNAAAAAAIASIPTIRGGVYLDSYDAKIIEFQYSIWKIELLTTHIKAMLIKVRNFPNLIPLVHYIETLIGPLLNISQGLTKKLESIVNLQTLTDSKKIVLPLGISELQYCLKDTDRVKADYSLSEVDYTQLLLDLLGVLDNALTIYQKRLEQATLERNAHRVSSPHTISSPFNSNCVKDLLFPSEITSLFKYVIEETDIETYQFQKSIFFIEAIQRELGELKKFEKSLSTYKVKPSDGNVKKLLFWSYTNHRVFSIYVRLADFYVIIRKFGRELYLPFTNSNHLPRLIQQHVNLGVALRQCDVYFKTGKHNDEILAKLSETTKIGANYQLRHLTIAEYSQNLSANLRLITRLTVALSEFVKGWEAISKKEIQAVGPTAAVAVPLPLKPRSKLSSVSTPVKTPIKKADLLFNGIKEIQSKKKEGQNKETPSVFKEPKLKEPQPKQPLIVSKTGSVRTNRLRSGSNASISSNSSSSSLNRSDTRSNPNSLLVSQSPASPTVSPSVNRRPASVYSSSPIFDIRTQLRRQEKLKAAESSQFSSGFNSPATSKPQPPSSQTVLCPRSYSLQNLQSPSSNERNNSLFASAAGAAALRKEEDFPLKENCEINRRTAVERHNSLRATPQANRSRSISPSPLRSKNNVDAPNIAKPLSHSKKSSTATPVIEVTPVKSPPPIKLTQAPVVVLNESSPKETKIGFILMKESLPLDEDDLELSASEPLPVVFSPSVKPLQKIDDVNKGDGDDDHDDDISELSPLDTPNLAETNSESSFFSEPTSIADSRFLKNQETLEDGTESQRIIKEVRFTGIPPLGPEPKPKRRGWVNPPKDLSHQKQSLASSIVASIQSERMPFQRVHEKDDGSFLSSVVKGNSRYNKGPKWRSLKDRFT